MGKVSSLHKKWSEDPKYRAAHDELESEFELARLLIKARAEAGLTQAELAKKIQTTQSAVARFESGRVNLSTKTLKKIADATGTKLRLSFEATGENSASLKA